MLDVSRKQEKAMTACTVRILSHFHLEKNSNVSEEITESLELEGTFEGHLDQFPYSEQEHHH